MIVEFLIMGSSFVGIAGCWAAVQKHKLTTQLEMHRLNNEVLKPAPEPVPPAPPRPEPSPTQQALTELLKRRRTLEDNQYEEKKYTLWRADTLKALEDARTEQQELVLEETGLLEMMQGADNDAAQKPVRIDPGGFVAERVADPGELHDAELHDEEASRESAA